jgi:hypothetical protein
MTIYRGIARGKMIELDLPLPYNDGQAVTVSVEPLATEFPLGSPAVILDAIRQLAAVRGEDVDELERSIEASQLPVIEHGLFDKER